MKIRALDIEPGDSFAMSPGAAFGRSARREIKVTAVERLTYEMRLTDQLGDTVTLPQGEIINVLRPEATRS